MITSSFIHELCETSFEFISGIDKRTPSFTTVWGCADWVELYSRGERVEQTKWEDPHNLQPSQVRCFIFSLRYTECQGSKLEIRFSSDRLHLKTPRTSSAGQMCCTGQNGCTTVTEKPLQSAASWFCWSTFKWTNPYKRQFTQTKYRTENFTRYCTACAWMVVCRGWSIVNVDLW